MEKQKNTYHWLIVISCFLLMAVSIGIIVNCFNPLVPALRESFGAGEDGGSIQLIFTIAVLANLIGGAIAGKVMSKVPMRKIMPVYAVVMSAGILGWSFSSQLWQLYLASIFVGLGASGISLVPCGILINNWFHEKKGVATGIAFTGSVAGGLIFVQFTEYVVRTSGWQQAYLMLGIIAAVISIPVTLFIIRGTPQEKGLLPFGVTKDQNLENTAASAGIKLKKFIKTSSFWLLAISGFIIGFANIGLQNNISTYLTGMGYSSAVATMAFSIGLFVQIFGKFLLGWFYDKKGILFSQIYCLICFIGCVTILLFAKGNIAIAYCFGVVFGLVASMTTVTPPYLTARIVGVRDYAIIFGIISLFYGLGVATGPIVVEGLFGSIGWTPILISLIVLSAIMLVTTNLSYRKGQGFASETD